MGWFFDTTDGLLSRTSLVVVKNAYPFEADFEGFLPCSWKAGKCSIVAVGCNRCQEMCALHDCWRAEHTAPPRIPLTRFAPCPKRVWFRWFNCWRLKTSTLAVSNSLGWERALLLFFYILLSGCHSRQGTPAPSIEFTKIPVAAVGGLDNMDSIEGRVIGLRPEQRIVLYAKSGGRWLIQPFARDRYSLKSKGIPNGRM